MMAFTSIKLFTRYMYFRDVYLNVKNVDVLCLDIRNAYMRNTFIKSWYYKLLLCSDNVKELNNLGKYLCRVNNLRNNLS